MAKLFLGTQESSPVIKETIYLPKTKFGASVDMLIGDVDANGAYIVPTETFELDLSGIKTVNDDSGDALAYFMFGKKNLVGTIDLSNFEGFSSRATGNVLYSGFNGTHINKVILPRAVNEQTVFMTFYTSFGNCTLDSVEFLFADYDKLRLTNTFYNSTIKELKGINNIQSIRYWEKIFYYATLPEELRFDSLTTLGNTALNAAFHSSKGLKKLYFPALTSVSTTSFSGSVSFSSTDAFGSGAIEEIHFRADMQATIEAINRYANKFGATNATIYFDL